MIAGFTQIKFMPIRCTHTTNSTSQDAPMPTNMATIDFNSQNTHTLKHSRSPSFRSCTPASNSPHNHSHGINRTFSSLTLCEVYAPFLGFVMIPIYLPANVFVLDPVCLVFFDIVLPLLFCLLIA
ncbi:hypothetical protein PDJAM_G00057730 [Pangasius djambal]|uniref:Uncharacterized protein n=1 Tax=Pangasius djambal TaxID=1691987 RepID=A0ACC5YZ88_9TELE|nr:hypothetical protein [Pangasius djambal]